MSVQVSDDFNRGDSGTLGSQWTKSPSNSAQEFSILSNEANANWALPVFNSQGSFWSADSFADDQYSQATLKGIDTVNGAALFVSVRHTLGTVSTFDLYGFGCRWTGAGGYFYVQKWINGSLTHLVTDSGDTPLVDDVLRLDVRGVSLVGREMARSAATLQVTDASITSGSAGLYAIAATDDTGKLDNWKGGDYEELIPSGFVGQYPTIIRGGGR